MNQVHESSLDGIEVVSPLQDCHNASERSLMAAPLATTLLQRCVSAFTHTANFGGRFDPCIVVALGLAMERLWSSQR